METNVTINKILDNRGSNCAAGFVRLLEMMEDLAPGEILSILSSDPASQRELQEWTKRSGHTLLKAEKAGSLIKREYHFLIQKGPTLIHSTQGETL